MNLSQAFINLSEKMRPVLVKILPMGLLRAVKDRMMERSFEKSIRDVKFEPYEKGLYPEGINLIGPVRAEIGLGQSCRLLTYEVDRTGIPYTIQDFQLDGDNLRAEDHTWEAKIGQETPYGINLFHIEPVDLVMGYVNTLDQEMWAKHYNIGFWLWELEEFPKSWIKALSLVDEVWTPSEFASESVRRVTKKPVYTIPYYVTAPTDPQYDRKYFGIPEDRFLFLAMYDTNSTMARKNPVGVIKAFQKAFAPEDTHVGLVLKMNNPRQEDLEALKAQLSGYSNIYYITEVMDKVVVNSLIANVDVFVSLHRAEGFGLVMAEAMLNGVPCIATNWSSNTEFMNEEVSCMVDYTFTTLEKTAPPYEKGARWADANIDTAADYMKRLSSDPEYYREKSEKGKAYVSEVLGIDQAVAKIQERVAEIQGK